MSGKQYAAIISSSYKVEGDERSRTNPGHGYPEHTVQYNEFLTFNDRETMQRWLEYEESKIFNKKSYKIIEYIELTIKSTITIETKVE
jgi:hypothetical protein